MKLQCVKCSAPLVLPSEQQEIQCFHCGYVYSADRNYLRYDAATLLFEEFRNQYLRNRVLNNNAEISYAQIKGGSLSTPDRADVRAFARFVAEHRMPGPTLDVGCGVLPLPAYLHSIKESGDSLYGLDPIDNRAFEGTRIVGCSEHVPFSGASFSTVIFATSIDHVCDLPATIRECHRILRPGGVVLVWMGDKSMSWLWRLRLFIWSRIKSFQLGYPVHRYAIYPNGTVLYIPDWAVDAFHSWRESPRELVRLMRRGGFRNLKLDYRNRDEIFLAFVREG